MVPYLKNPLTGPGSSLLPFVPGYDHYLLLLDFLLLDLLLLDLLLLDSSYSTFSSLSPFSPSLDHLGASLDDFCSSPHYFGLMPLTL